MSNKYFAAILLIVGLQSQAQIPSDTLSVLFVGNSYTYYQNLPHIVSLISDSTSTKIIAKKSTAGGATLEHHWIGDRGLRTTEIIKNGQFNIVVIQESSLGPIDHPERFKKYAKLLGDLIIKSGAKPYFFITWARERVPQYQEILTKRYTQAAKEVKGNAIPAGPGWELARKLRPQLSLFTSDGSHPADLGTYLTACIFVGELTGEYPQKLPLRYYTTDQDHESVELLRMTALDIQFCIRIAEQIVKEFD